MNASTRRYTGNCSTTGTQLDGIYFCPVVPADGDRTVVEDLDRKPGPGMLLRAAKDMDLDLSHSWIVGDMLSDLLAGRNAGCRETILLKTGYGNMAAEDHDAVDRVAPDLLGAAHIILDRIRDLPQADEMRRRVV